MKIIDGNNLAKELKNKITQEVAKINKSGGKITLAVILVGHNPASQIYVAKKEKECANIGINFILHKPETTITQKKLEDLIAALSNDKTINGILLQLPLPAHLDANAAIEKIAPIKDVDGLTYKNFGHLAKETPILTPCTACGVLYALKSVYSDLAGKTAAVIGRSSLVGKPTALLLSKENATVTVTHSKTKNLSLHTKTADIVVVAAGKPKLLTADMVKKDAVVIDVGVNRLPDGTIAGDCDYEEIAKKASAITPVPGGIGPLTIAFLLSNTVTAYKLQQQ
jgi:methylenetetrahydrofolate dehydrogenase (NADP+)/methenyltetrahydrofolate cyclohydrolase